MKPHVPFIHRKLSVRTEGACSLRIICMREISGWTNAQPYVIFSAIASICCAAKCFFQLGKQTADCHVAALLARTGVTLFNS